MTADLAVPAPARAAPRRATTAWAADAAVAVALVGLLLVSTRTGGRDRGAVLLGLGCLVPALAVLRPRVPWPALALPGAALLSCVVAPRGWAGVGDVAVWAYAALGYAVARAYGKKPALVLGLAVAGAHQVWSALTPWLGGGDPARPMIGTFYWHNQFGVWVAAAGVAAGAAALFGRRWAALGGGAAFALCGAGVVLSTSRATLALFVLAWLALGVGVLLRRRLRGAARWAVASVSVAALATVLTGPVLFPGRAGGALAATERRSQAESVSGNAHYRLDYWRAAVAVAAEHPLTGTGSGGYGPASRDHLPAGMPGSPYAHNALLQAYAEGGLPLGLAMTAVLVAALVACGGAAWRFLRGTGEWAPFALALAAGVLLAHALVDFDTSYPALPVLAALALGGVPVKPPRRWPVAALAAVLAVAVSAAALDDAARRGSTPLPDPRPATTALLNALPDHPGGPLRSPDATVRKALRDTARAATVDPALAVRREVAYAALGDAAAPGRALRIAGARPQRPLLLTYAADALAQAGRTAEGVSLVAAAFDRATPDTAWDLVAWLARAGAPEAACAANRAKTAFGAPPAGITALLSGLPGCSATGEAGR